jgi:hypothetical protein
MVSINQRWDSTDASHMENLNIQPFNQTLIQEGGGLEVGMTA